MNILLKEKPKFSAEIAENGSFLLIYQILNSRGSNSTSIRGAIVQYSGKMKQTTNALITKDLRPKLDLVPSANQKNTFTQK